MRPQWDMPIRYIVLIFLLILVIAALWYVREIFQPLITAGSDRVFPEPGCKLLRDPFSVAQKNRSQSGLLFVTDADHWLVGISCTAFGW